MNKKHKKQKRRGPWVRPPWMYPRNWFPFNGIKGLEKISANAS